MSWKTIHKDCSHCGWSRGRSPVHRCAPGQVLEMEVHEASGGVINPGSSAEDLQRLQPEKANPTTGPVAIEGALPGDLLEVRLLGFQTSDWGWTALIPGFGLLADEFTEPWLRISQIREKRVYFGDGLEIPLRPFPGTIGVVPDENSDLPSIPPHRCGGNLDCHDLVEGCSLFLPVEVPDALFSIGDMHAAQGGGEVCGTAVESPMQVQLRFELHKGRGGDGLFFESPVVKGNVQESHTKFRSSLGVSDDLVGAARDAVRRTVDWLVHTVGMKAETAYAWCSVRGDLRIAQIVNLPNYTVQFSIPYPG